MILYLFYKSIVTHGVHQLIYQELECLSANRSKIGVREQSAITWHVQQQILPFFNCSLDS
jgi:hypothetical protein